MSNLEHLIENGLSALKRGISYEKWLKTMKDDVNWQGNENISIEQLWAICQYVIYTWMPSAQPKERTETHASDCISRQAAIDMIMGQPPEAHYPSWYAEQIKALPSAERKKGKWIRKEVKGIPFCCSVCTGRFDYEWKYCPNCGADMREDEQND